MAKLVHVSRKKHKKWHRKLEKLLAKDEFWQEELKRIKYFETEEKVRREAQHKEQLNTAQSLTEVSR